MLVLIVAASENRGELLADKPEPPLIPTRKKNHPSRLRRCRQYQRLTLRRVELPFGGLVLDILILSLLLWTFSHWHHDVGIGCALIHHIGTPVVWIG
jgi:hypothetical protein